MNRPRYNPLRTLRNLRTLNPKEHKDHRVADLWYSQLNDLIDLVIECEYAPEDLYDRSLWDFYAEDLEMFFSEYMNCNVIAKWLGYGCWNDWVGSRITEHPILVKYADNLVK